MAIHKADIFSSRLVFSFCILDIHGLKFILMVS